MPLDLLAWPDAIDTSEDYTKWTNTVTVEYLSKSVEAPPAIGAFVSNVLWFMIQKNKLAADSPLMKYDRTFRIARIPFENAVLGSLTTVMVPKQNDIIVDDQQVRWVVGLVEILSYGNEFRCHCIKGGIQNVAVIT